MPLNVCFEDKDFLKLGQNSLTCQKDAQVRQGLNIEIFVKIGEQKSC